MTSTPSDPAAIVRRLLGQVRRRRRWGRVARAVCAGLLTGAVIRIALIAASWLGDWRPAPMMLAGTWLFGPLAGAALALVRRDSWRDAAAAVDRYGSLNDRTITAWELLSRPPTPLADLQIAETAARLAGIEASAVVRWRMPKLLPCAVVACYLSVWIPICPTVQHGGGVAARIKLTTPHGRRHTAVRQPRPQARQFQQAAAPNRPADRQQSAPRPSPREHSLKRVARKPAKSADHRNVSRTPTKRLKQASDANALAIVAAELDFKNFFDVAERGNAGGNDPAAVATRSMKCSLTPRSNERPIGMPGTGGQSAADRSPPLDKTDQSTSTDRTTAEESLTPTIDALDVSSTPLEVPSTIEWSSSAAPSASPDSGTELGQPNADQPTADQPNADQQNADQQNAAELPVAATRATDELSEPVRRATKTSTAESLHQSAGGSHQRRDDSSAPAAPPKASAKKTSVPARSAEGRSNLTPDGKKHLQTRPAKKPPAAHSSPSKPGPSQGRGFGLPAAAGGYSGPRGNNSSESQSNGSGGRGGPGGKGGAGPSGGGRLPKESGAPRPATDDGYLQSDRPSNLYQFVEPNGDSSGQRSAELWPSQSGPLTAPSESGSDAGEPASSEAEPNGLPRDSSQPGSLPSDRHPRRTMQPSSRQRQPATGADSSLPLTGARAASGPTRIESWRASEARQPARRPWQEIEYVPQPIDEAPPVVETIPAEQRPMVRRYFEAIRRTAP